MNETLIILNDLKEITSKQDIHWDKLKDKTVLITGASGMIGQYIVKTLQFLNQFYDMNINIVTLGRDSMLTENLMLKCHYFFYAASPAGSCEFIEDELFQCNVIGVFNVLNYLKNKPERKLKGFAFFSSGEALHPSNHYGYNKRTGENLCRYYNTHGNLPTYIFRFDHTFAPTMNLEKDKRVFASIVKDILNDYTPLINNPDATRTFTYITDAIDGLFRGLLNGETGEYNISNKNNYISIGSLSHTLSNKGIIFKDALFDERTPLNTTTLTELGYNPTVDVIDGFQRVINHFKELKNA